MDKKKIAAVVVTAAALAFVTAPITSTLANAASTKVPCYGVNSCKGKSACKTASNSCKGTNACKGHGMVMKTEKACKKMKGTTVEPAAEPAAS